MSPVSRTTRNVPFQIITYPGLGDVGNLAAAAFWVRTASEAPACNDPTEAIARAVAFRAVTRTVNEVGPAIPLGQLGRIGLERAAVEEQKFPYTENAAKLELEAQIVVARLALNSG